MATTRARPAVAETGDPAGAREAPPVDALHPHGRVRRWRGADHRAGRGRVRLRRARQALPRRAVGAVLRQRRPRARRARRRRGGPGPRARLLHHLELRAPARDRARGPARLARARATSTASSSPRAARRPWSRRSSSPAPTTSRPATRARRSSSPGRSPTTGPRSALCGDRDPAAAHALRAARPRRGPRPEHEQLPVARRRDPLWAADAIEEKILFEGPETVAAVILEPLQNAGGGIPPQEGYFQRVREICDRHDVLLISDEVICAFGRLGHYFGCQRTATSPTSSRWPRP